MKRLIPILGAALVASPIAPTGCETTASLNYRGQYADYGASYDFTRRQLNLSATSDAKRIRPSAQR